MARKNSLGAFQLPAIPDNPEMVMIQCVRGENAEHGVGLPLVVVEAFVARFRADATLCEFLDPYGFVWIGDSTAPHGLRVCCPDHLQLTEEGDAMLNAIQSMQSQSDRGNN
jgi:hypothetical protein